MILVSVQMSNGILLVKNKGLESYMHKPDRPNPKLYFISSYAAYKALWMIDELPERELENTEVQELLKMQYNADCEISDGRKVNDDFDFCSWVNLHLSSRFKDIEALWI